MRVLLGWYLLFEGWDGMGWLGGGRSIDVYSTWYTSTGRVGKKNYNEIRVQVLDTKVPTT